MAASGVTGSVSNASSSTTHGTHSGIAALLQNAGNHGTVATCRP